MSQKTEEAPTSPNAQASGPASSSAANPGAVPKAPETAAAAAEAADKLIGEKGTGKPTPEKDNDASKDTAAQTSIKNQAQISGTQGDINVIGQQEVNIQETRNYLVGQVGPAKIFVSYCTKLRIDSEILEAEKHIHDELVISRFVSSLQTRRMLIISAEPESGKASTAVYVAHRLRQSDSNLKESEITHVRTLEPDVSIHLPSLIQNDDSFRNCVVFFEDFLDYQNRDLARYLVGFDERLASSLCRDLEARGSYLIFTTDQRCVEQHAPQLQSLKVYATLPPLSPDQLAQGLDAALERRGVTISSEQREEIRSRAGTMSRIVRFVEDELAFILEGKLSIEEAFARMDDVSLWLRELRQDFDAWSFAFVLALARSVAGRETIAWSEFQDLYSGLLKPIRRWAGTPEAYFSYHPERLFDKDLFAKAQVEVFADPQADCYIVRFRDQARLKNIWRALIKDTIRLLTFLLPSLQELAEGDNWRLRVHAARILGRLGEIDPIAITGPVLQKWANSDSRRKQATTGYLFQGILHSENEAYKKRSLAMLERMGQSDGQTRVWTAIAAYRQIGILDLPQALSQLKLLAENKLAPQLTEHNEISRALRRIEQQFQKQVSDQKLAARLAVAHELLRHWGIAILEGQLPIVFALQYALVALCLAWGPLRVFKELRKWLRGPEGLRGLVCLLYLESNGIAHELSQHEAELDSAFTNPQNASSTNILVMDLISDAYAPRQFAEFLEDVFANFNTAFPIDLAGYLQKAFLNHLLSLVAGASEFPKGLKALEDVFVRLLISPIRDLKTQTLELLTTEEEFLKKGSKAKEFAAAVLKRGLTETPGRVKSGVSLADVAEQGPIVVETSN